MPRTIGSKNGIRCARRGTPKVSVGEGRRENFNMRDVLESDNRRELDAQEEGRTQSLRQCDELLESVEDMLIMAVEMRKKLRALQKAQ